MRLRRKPWARPELAASPFFIDCPEQLRGRWRSAFVRSDAPLWLELGCGKGGFAACCAAANPDVNVIAVDLKSEVLALAGRRAEQEFAAAKRPVDNLLLLSWDIERIDDVLAPREGIARIIINFCNPWPKERHQKHRLTHTRQLRKYRALMAPEGELVFKTDDKELFAATLGYLAEAGWQMTDRIDELPADHPAAACMSEHEQMFRAKGIAIQYLTAIAKGEPT